MGAIPLFSSLISIRIPAQKKSPPDKALLSREFE
jgi:hypothetical protein